MSEIVLEIDKVSKQYKLGVIGSGSLSYDLKRWWAKIKGKEDPTTIIGHNDLTQAGGEYVWALKDISFKVNKGEVLGIIGKNGAGKSTLLKLLSKVTAPSTGSIKLKGRVASLLEVGTGFHPELTGKENIFLNGAILGMTKDEIKNKIDEIIEFAGIGKYINTPVKRYSSGMYVRLAFAVASHLESEILIVDEVLAVGDTTFQQKCMDKMINISKGGRTILFVSHNMAAIKAICGKALLLNKGQVQFEGNVENAISLYNKNAIAVDQNEITLTNVERKQKVNKLMFDQIIFDKPYFEFGQNLKFKFKLRKVAGFKDPVPNLDIGINILDHNLTNVFHYSNRFLNMSITHKNDSVIYELESECNLRPGFYYITLFLSDGYEVLDWLPEAVKIQIKDGNPYNFPNTSTIQGLVLPKFSIHEVY